MHQHAAGRATLAVLGAGPKGLAIAALGSRTMRNTRSPGYQCEKGGSWVLTK